MWPRWEVGSPRSGCLKAFWVVRFIAFRRVSYGFVGGSDGSFIGFMVIYQLVKPRPFGKDSFPGGRKIFLPWAFKHRWS